MWIWHCGASVAATIEDSELTSAQKRIHDVQRSDSGKNKRAGVWKARIRQRFVGLARDVIWLRSLNDWECRQTSGAIW